MNSLLILVPVTVVLFGVAIAVFVWAVRRGQFDDLDTPALDILADDDQATAKSSPRKPQSDNASSRAD